MSDSGIPIDTPQTRELLDRSFRVGVETMLEPFGAYEAIRDAGGRIIDFEIVHVNEPACVDLSVPREQQVGRRLCELFPAIRETGYFDFYVAVVERGVPFVEDGFERGSRFWDMRVSRVGDGFVACWRDVTARKQLERELARSNELLRAVIETSPAAIFAKDLDGRYVMVNPVTARNMGMLGPILGHTDAELLPADVAVRLMATDEEVLTSGQVVVREEILELGGETRSFQSVKTPLRDGTGQLIGLCGIATDITAYKRVERELRAANDERARLLTIAEDARGVSEALSRSKDQFLATISHELRTPLTAVLGYVHMLQKGLVAPERRDAVLDTIDRNATLQLQLIDDILDMSAIMRGKVALQMQRVDLGAVLSLAVDSLIPAITAKGLILTCEIGDQSAVADGDPRRLHQVFSNMLSNAIKFTPSDGQISVALRTEGDDYVIDLADTGAGIPSDFLPHVFEQFSQAADGRTNQHGGLGLGLSIAQFLIRQHQGTIAVESPGLNQGTTVRVRLPRATDVDR